MLRLVGEDEGRRATKLDDGVGNAHTFAKGHDADLCLEKVDIKLEEDVPCDFLLCETVT